jgi:beta-glucosidase
VSGADAIRFQYGFPSGAATAAHQVEGGNVACDIWVLERLPNTVFRERSGDA